MILRLPIHEHDVSLSICLDRSRNICLHLPASEKCLRAKLTSTPAGSPFSRLSDLGTIKSGVVPTAWVIPGGWLQNFFSKSCKRLGVVFPILQFYLIIKSANHGTSKAQCPLPTTASSGQHPPDLSTLRNGPSSLWSVSQWPPENLLRPPASNSDIYKCVLWNRKSSEVLQEWYRCLQP